MGKILNGNNAGISHFAKRAIKYKARERYGMFYTVFQGLRKNTGTVEKFLPGVILIVSRTLIFKHESAYSRFAGAAPVVYKWFPGSSIWPGGMTFRTVVLTCVIGPADFLI